MEILLIAIMGIGGLMALLAGGALWLFGDRLRAADERAGRNNAKAMTPAAQRRFGMIMTIVGALFVLATLFLL